MPAFERVGRVLSVLFGAMPFAFALIRAWRTGSDVRYVWVALASLAGAMAVVGLSRSLGRTLALALAGAAAVFVLSTVCAVLAAMLLGTRLGPGILIVAASFGLCFAASSLLRALPGLSRTNSGS